MQLSTMDEKKMDKYKIIDLNMFINMKKQHILCLLQNMHIYTCIYVVWDHRTLIQILICSALW